MANIYPETLPSTLRDLPDLLKGKVADAAEMFLASRCDYDGALACEMAARLLDEEMTSEDTHYSLEECFALFEIMKNTIIWSMTDGSDLVVNPVISHKISFVVKLTCSYCQRARYDYGLFLSEARSSANNLAMEYREILEGIEAVQADDLFMAEGM